MLTATTHLDDIHNYYFWNSFWRKGAIFYCFTEYNTINSTAKLLISCQRVSMTKYLVLSICLPVFLSACILVCLSVCLYQLAPYDIIERPFSDHYCPCQAIFYPFPNTTQWSLFCYLKSFVNNLQSL